MSGASESLMQFRRWFWREWHFGTIRGVKCWPRLRHSFSEYDSLVCNWKCARCGVFKGEGLPLLLLWGTPVVWRVSFLAKHHRWPTRRARRA